MRNKTSRSPAAVYFATTSRAVVRVLAVQPVVDCAWIAWQVTPICEDAQKGDQNTGDCLAITIRSHPTNRSQCERTQAMEVVWPHW